jgi:hypothetical protein
LKLQDIDNDLKVIEHFAKTFWRTSQARDLNTDEQEDVLQTGRLLIYKYPFDDKRKDNKGRPVSREHYVRQLLPTALQIWRCNQKLRTEAASQLEANQAEDQEQVEAMLERVPDPLSTPGRPNSRARNEGGAVLSDEFCLSDLVSPPYRAHFPSASSTRSYLDNPYFVPYFEILPRKEDVLAVATHGGHRGKRRFFGKKDLPVWTQEALKDRRVMMGLYIRALIPAYLANFGFSSLDQKHKNIVSDINRRGMSPKQIQAKRRISSNTYYAYLNVLKRRGWDWEWHEKKKRDVLRYNPVLDRCESFYSSTLVDIENIDIEAVLNLAGPLIENQLYQAQPSEQEVSRELRQVRKELRKAAADLSVEADYDRRLRAFISSLVDRPIESALGFKDIEERFKMLPFKKRLGLFCEAVRTRQSIVDVMGFEVLFADVLYDRRELEALAGVPSLSSLLLAKAA